MCVDDRTHGAGELSRKLGEKGDLVACHTSEIGIAVERGREIPQDVVEELEGAIDEIEELLEAVDDAEAVGPTAEERSVAD